LESLVMADDSDPPSRRQHWMSVLARATAGEMQARLPPLPAYVCLRGPEAGLVMVRGRAGGAGSPFNLGEATVARCTVRVQPAGTVGHAYCLGRDLRQAELAAVLDALLQDPDAGPALEAQVVAPLAEAQAARRALLARRAAATQVQFFTLATMRS